MPQPLSRPVRHALLLGTVGVLFIFCLWLPRQQSETFPELADVPLQASAATEAEVGGPAPGDDGEAHEGGRESRCSSESPPFRVLAFGDSITSGGFGIFEHPEWGMHHNNYSKPMLGFHPYTRQLQDLLKEHRYTRVVLSNKGLQGETAEHMETRLRYILKNEPFDVAVLLAGVNDLRNGMHVQRVKSFVRSLHQAFQEHNVTVFQVSLPHCCPFPKTPQMASYLTRCQELNAHLAQTYKNRFIDLASYIPMKESTKAFWDDCVHYSPSGYDLLGALVFRHLRPHLEATCRARRCSAACPAIL